MLSEILAQLLCWRLIEMQADHLRQESEPFWMFELPEAKPGWKGFWDSGDGLGELSVSVVVPDGQAGTFAKDTLTGSNPQRFFQVAMH